MNKSVLPASDTRITDIEELLERAGLDFTVVERCPFPDCDVCAHKRLSAAA